MEKLLECDLCPKSVQNKDVVYCVSKHTAESVVCKEKDHSNCNVMCSEECHKLHTEVYLAVTSKEKSTETRSVNGCNIWVRTIRRPPENVYKFDFFLTPSQIALEKLKETDRRARLARKLNKKNNKGYR